MIGKVAAGLVAAFWVAMMVALVRLEFFPQPAPIGNVSSERVLRTLFANPEPARLNVYYQGADIGTCRVEVTPSIVGDPDSPAKSNRVYQVRSELMLAMSVFGMPSRLRLVGRSLFNHDYSLDNFNLKTTISDNSVEIHGDAASKKVNVLFAFGNTVERREFDFNQVQGAGVASALGLPGLANFGLLGGGAPADFGNSPPSAAPSRSATTIYLGHLKIGDTSLRTFVMESKMDRSMWAKIWISEVGEVLRVDTSMGLTMLSDNFANQPELARHHPFDDPH